MRDATDYKQQLNALLPPGPLWEALRQDDNAQSLLIALADELARLDDRAYDLLRELDPRSVSELLAEWEAWAGLPDSCSGLGETLNERRDALHAAMTSSGGQSRAYFIALAERLGFPGTSITEYEPHTVEDDVDAAIYGDDWRFAWLLSAQTPDIQQISVESDVDESLGEQAPTERLECAINKTKPAHTVALFEYT
ncbi:MAG: putative phage tail protein [Pseudomonadota bacterium]